LIKISLLHPSFGRPDMAYITFKEWANASKNPQEIEYFVGLDECDDTIDSYKARFNIKEDEVGKFLMDVGDSDCAVKAVNRLATKISNSSELLVEICDDISSIPEWDVKLLLLLEGINNFEEPKMIGTHDGLRDYGVVFTQPIMNRACYNKLGFVVYPEYTSMFADNDFTDIARVTGYLIDAPHILFKHKHYSIGMNTLDNTYIRRNNPEEFSRNERIYIDRKKRNFDL